MSTNLATVANNRWSSDFSFGNFLLLEFIFIFFSISWGLLVERVVKKKKKVEKNERKERKEREKNYNKIGKIAGVY